MTKSQALFRLSYWFLLIGGPVSTAALIWLVLPVSANEGMNYGGTGLAFIGWTFLFLGVVLGPVGLLYRSSERKATRSRGGGSPSTRQHASASR